MCLKKQGLPGRCRNQGSYTPGQYPPKEAGIRAKCRAKDTREKGKQGNMEEARDILGIVVGEVAKEDGVCLLVKHTVYHSGEAEVAYIVERREGNVVSGDWNMEKVYESPIAAPAVELYQILASMGAPLVEWQEEWLRQEGTRVEFRVVMPREEGAKVCPKPGQKPKGK